MKALITLFIILGLLLPATAWANTATLSWTPPTQYEDGSAIGSGEIKSYKIYYGTKQGGPYNFIATVPGANNTVTIENLTNGTWYFVATTVSSQDAESTTTPEVSKVVNVIKKPRAPTGFIIK